MRGLVFMALIQIPVLGCASQADPRLNVNQDLEMPKYQVLKASGHFELRHYQPHLIAQVDVSGDFDEASRKGFRHLAGYIFGGNRSETSISMTAPVSMRLIGAQNDTSKVSPLSVVGAGDRQWRVTFSMPSKYTLETLPTPKNDRVKLLRQPMQTVAVIIFSGRSTQERLRQHEEQLRDWIIDEGYESSDEYTVARYNDPLTFPWNRRNEILINVRSLDDDQ